MGSGWVGRVFYRGSRSVAEWGAAAQKEWRGRERILGGGREEKTVTFIFLPFPLLLRPAGQWELLTAPGKKQLWPRGKKGREKDEDG